MHRAFVYSLLTLVVAASCLLQSRQIGSVGALSTMLIVAVIADLISTHAGPSRWLADQAQHARGVAALQWPEAPALVVPLVGLLSALGVGLFAGFTPALRFLAAAVLLYAYASHSLQHEPCRG